MHIHWGSNCFYLCFILRTEMLSISSRGPNVFTNVLFYVWKRTLKQKKITQVVRFCHSFLIEMFYCTGGTEGWDG